MRAGPFAAVLLLGVRQNVPVTTLPGTSEMLRGSRPPLAFPTGRYDVVRTLRPPPKGDFPLWGRLLRFLMNDPVAGGGLSRCHVAGHGFDRLLGKKSSNPGWGSGVPGAGFVPEVPRLAPRIRPPPARGPGPRRGRRCAASLDLSNDYLGAHCGGTLFPNLSVRLAGARPNPPPETTGTVLWHFWSWNHVQIGPNRLFSKGTSQRPVGGHAMLRYLAHRNLRQMFRDPGRCQEDRGRTMSAGIRRSDRYPPRPDDIRGLGEGRVPGPGFLKITTGIFKHRSGLHLGREQGRLRRVWVSRSPSVKIRGGGGYPRLYRDPAPGTTPLAGGTHTEGGLVSLTGRYSRDSRTGRRSADTNSCDTSGHWTRLDATY
eukprot:gene22196-biopygen8726